jgi:hypothetical protein
MSKIPIATVRQHFNTLLKEHDVPAKEAAANKQAHDETYQKARQIVSEAVNSPTDRDTTISQLRDVEAAYRKKHPETSIPADALGSLCGLVDDEGHLTPFNSYKWWPVEKQSEE